MTLKKKRITFIASFIILIGVFVGTGMLVQADNDEEQDISKNKDNHAKLEEALKDSKEHARKLASSHDDSLKDDALGNKEELEKWIFRLKIDNAMMGQQLNDESLIEKASESMHKRNVTLSFAEDVYGVEFDENEVGEMIKEEMEQANIEGEMDKTVALLTEELGITEKEFMYDWEYDNFLNVFAWREIRPFLEAKYPMKANEESLDYHERLLTEYDKEISEYAKKNNLEYN